MTREDVAAALRELAQGKQHRSETARLRDVISDVEAALTAGVSRTAVLATLNAQGFSMTLKSFESALYRIRKQQRSGPGEIGHRPPLPPTVDQKEGEIRSEKPRSRITSPADVRQARNRDIDLESFT